ncbi:sulfotransferase [Palleronia aestuarii]|nr:sulfotransferase [Palleronia aestuarii]
MTLPNCFFIEAAKAGTTSLHTCLDQHSDIFIMERGEPSFFQHAKETLNFTGSDDKEWAETLVTDPGDYRALVNRSGGLRARGEISPCYLYFDKAPERIPRDIPQVRLIVILRHPVDWAYSHSLMNRARGCEPATTLANAIDKEAERAVSGWDWRYIDAGLYHRQMDRYYCRFPRDRIKVFLYDDLKDHDEFFTELFEFLGMDPAFHPDTSIHYRTASLPRNAILRDLVTKPSAAKSMLKRLLLAGARTLVKQRASAWNFRPPERLAPDTRRDLFQRYIAEEFRKLEPLIKKSLHEWFH